MTIETNDTIERVVIDGVGPYAFSFRIYEETDLAVYVDTGGLDPVQLELNTHYTVDGLNAQDGGEITLLTETADTYDGDTLDIRSNVSRKQPTSIRNLGSFHASTHEDAFDRMARQIQDLSRRVDRKFGYPDSSLLEGEMSLFAAWLGRYLYVNETTGVIEPAVAITPQALTGSIIGALLNPITQSEINVGASIVDYSIPSHEKIGYVIVERYGVNTTPGTTPMQDAIHTAIAVARAARVRRVTSRSSIIALSATLNLESYVHLDFAYGESDVGGGTVVSGAELRWIGSNGGTVMRAFNCRMFEASNFWINGNTHTGCTAFLLDSNNAPSGSQNTIHHFNVRECLVGVKWGTSGIAGGSYANDGTEFHTFTIWSDEALSDGFVINSGNAGQMSVIRNGGIQTQRRGIDIQVANILLISQVFGGGVMDDAFIRAATAIGITIRGCSSECWGIGKTWRTNKPKFLRVVKPVGAGAETIYPIIESGIKMDGNQVNNPVELGYPCRVTSDSDNWGYCKDYATDVDGNATGAAVAGPEWSAVTAYVVSDVVTRNGLPYFCIQAHTNQAPPNAAYWSAERGKSRVVAVNNGVNPGSIDLNTSEPTHGWLDNNYAHLSLTDPGRPWVRPAFDAAVYDAAGATTWTVASTDVESYEYKLIERTMTVSFRIVTSSVSDSASTELRINIPAGKVASRPMANAVQIDNNGTKEVGIAFVEVGETFIRINRMAGGAFTASTNLSAVKGQLTFMVD